MEQNMVSSDDLISASILDQRAAFANLEDFVPRICAAVELIVSSLKSGGKILWCGNGGSAAEAQHMAAELMGRFNLNRRAIASVALTTDTSFLTGYSNDLGFDQVFARQVEGLGKKGDVLVAYSTSGNSANVLLAIEVARRYELKVITLIGGDGGLMSGLGDLEFRVNSQKTPRIQEVHQFLGHSICSEVERIFCV